MKNWYSWFLSGRKALSRSSRGLWTGVTEALLASLLIVLGVLLLVTVISLNVIFSTPDGMYMSVTFLILQLLLGVAMISIGTWLVLISLWKVGASAERRAAIASQAGEIELIAELRKKRDDLPTIPTAQSLPVPGVTFPYRLRASKQNYWELISAGLLGLLFAAVATVLAITAIVKFQRFETGPFTAARISADQVSSDWFAGALAIPIALVAVWAVVRFFRQLLKLTSIGPTHLEFSTYPVFPGETVEIFLSQTARSRLKFIDIGIACVEKATFSEGTNTRTEQRTVFQQRLFRKRGINTVPNQPFESRFEMTVPDGAMHTFSSASNRVIWKIEFQSQISRYPEVTRSFEFIVQPNGESKMLARTRQKMQPA